MSGDPTEALERLETLAKRFEVGLGGEYEIVERLPALIAVAKAARDWSGEGMISTGTGREGCGCHCNRCREYATATRQALAALAEEGKG